MIKKVLTDYASRLDEYLSSLHRQPEGMVEVGFIGNSSEMKPNKMVVTLISVERETGSGISAPVQRTMDGYTRMSPPLLLNLNIMLAAVYDEKRYAESLSVLSDSLKFVQSVPRFQVDYVDYSIEIVILSTQDVNNIWTTLGGQYYPSVMCKIRRLTIDAEEIISSGGLSKKQSVSL
ncbi:MAG: Pvc16 family protein [Bacteroidales bacterium]